MTRVSIADTAESSVSLKKYELAKVAVAAAIVTVAVLFETADTVALTPVGAVVAVVPVAELYQLIVPIVPSATEPVVTPKVAVPALPAVSFADCNAMLTVSVVDSSPELFELLEPDGFEHPPTTNETDTSAARARHRAENRFFMFFPLRTQDVGVIYFINWFYVKEPHPHFFQLFPFTLLSSPFIS
jgi:hypothetical protein